MTSEYEDIIMESFYILVNDYHYHFLIDSKRFDSKRNCDLSFKALNASFGSFLDTSMDITEPKFHVISFKTQVYRDSVLHQIILHVFAYLCPILHQYMLNFASIKPKFRMLDGHRTISKPSNGQVQILRIHGDMTLLS